MDWVCLLLDAHFTILVMTPEAKGLLLSLHSFVKSQVTTRQKLYCAPWLDESIWIRLNIIRYYRKVCPSVPQVRLVSELGKIEGSLQELSKMKVKKDVGQYSIEVIELF